MNITVTFTGSDDPNLPDGSSLVFENVSQYAVSTPADIRRVDCDRAGCEGCRGPHHEFTGTAHLELTATAHGSRPVWKFPEAVT